jgi:hypothetical protein
MALRSCSDEEDGTDMRAADSRWSVSLTTLHSTMTVFTDVPHTGMGRALSVGRPTPSITSAGTRVRPSHVSLTALYSTETAPEQHMSLSQHYTAPRQHPNSTHNGPSLSGTLEKQVACLPLLSKAHNCGVSYFSQQHTAPWQHSHSISPQVSGANSGRAAWAGWPSCGRKSPSP